MLIGSQGAHPTREDLFELAASVDLRRYRPIFEEVRQAVARFAAFADEAGLPRRESARVAKALR